MKRHYLIHIALYAIFLLVITPFYAQVELLPDFSIQDVNHDLDKPIGLVFDQDGKMYAWEKKGQIWLIEEGGLNSRVLLDISEEVSSFGDIGFMSVVLDPEFHKNGFLYCYYAVDFHHLIHFGTPSYDSEKNDYLKATIGRLTRYTVDFSNEFYTIDPSSRKILIGKTKENGVPILHNAHIGGGLVFGDDGTLLLSIGDCTTWEGNYVGDGPPYYNAKIAQALDDGIIRIEEEVGAMRAQLVNSYSGKIIRIDPLSGLGIPSNPFYESDDPDAPGSKVWALGFRNPYRMAIRKGSGSTDPGDALPGTLFVGEVGAGEWEELNIVTKKGENFGWPIFEGNNFGSFAELLQTNKDVWNDCNGENILFQDLIKQASLNEVHFPNPCDSTLLLDDGITFVHRRPDLAMAHITVGLGVYTTTFDSEGKPEHIRIEDERSNISSDVGDLRSNAAMAGAIYTGDKFPEDFKNDLFITDFNNGWISRVELDLNEKVTGLYKFYKDTFKIAHLTENTLDGCLYIIEYEGGIRKICYDVNAPPIVQLEVAPNFGSSPLDVQFLASSSYDPEGSALDFLWDFGNGENSNMPDPLHRFESDQIETIEGQLTITDAEGASTTKEWKVYLNNRPPEVTIRGLSEPYLYSVVGNNIFNLQADVRDQESDVSALETKWTLFLHHNTHYHEEFTVLGEEANLTVPPVGCGDEVFFYRILLESTDPFGLTGSDEIFIYPDCSDVFATFGNLEARLENEEVLLSWNTKSEMGLEYFVVEKAGSDKLFYPLGSIAPEDVLSGAEYQYIDQTPEIGLNYYRIKFIGNSMTEAFSDESKVFYNPNSGVYLYPNPSSGFINLHFKDLNGSAAFQLYNLEGKLLFESNISGIGESIKTLRIDNMPNEGIYPYKIINGEEITRGTLMIAQ